jgi:hypothetical protein
MSSASKPFVDAVELAEAPRRTGDELGARVELGGADAAHAVAAVAVGDDDPGGAGVEGAGDRGVRLDLHRAAAELVVEAGRVGLLAVDDARAALHVDGDVDVHASPPWRSSSIATGRPVSAER